MEKPGCKIVMLGAGNVAWHLAPALEKAGHEITAVYSRTLESAEALAQKLKNAVPTNNPDFSHTEADLFIIAVRDAALPELIQNTIFPVNSLVAHTSGTVPISVFELNLNITGAVFYPLQTFSKEVPVNFQEIPFCLECANENGMLLLQKTAGSLSSRVYKVTSGERKMLHLAAVFASNFTNHLLGISAEILKQNNLDFMMLRPLVEQTVAKAFTQDPFKVQTGPAIRHDETTIQTQLKTLREQPMHQEIYALLTRSIQEQK